MPRTFVAPLFIESARPIRRSPTRKGRSEGWLAHVAPRLAIAADGFAAAGLAIVAVGVPGWLVRDLSALSARQATAAPGDAAAFLVQPGASGWLLAWLVPGGLLLAAAALVARLASAMTGRAARHVATARPAAGAPATSGAAVRAGRPADQTRAGRAADAVADGALAALVGATIALAALPGLLTLAGFRSVTLTSGSMAPALPGGAFVIERPPGARASLEPGDVVTVARPDGTLLTHRVAAVVATAQGVSYQTRGDAAAGPDADLVAPSQVAGVVVAGVPALGGLRAWIFSPVGAAAIGLLACALALLPRGRPRAHATRGA